MASTSAGGSADGTLALAAPRGQAQPQGVLEMLAPLTQVFELTFQSREELETGLETKMAPVMELENYGCYVGGVGKLQIVTMAVEAYNSYKKGQEGWKEKRRSELGSRQEFLKRYTDIKSERVCSNIHAAAGLWRKLAERRFSGRSQLVRLFCSGTRSFFSLVVLPCHSSCAAFHSHSSMPCHSSWSSPYFTGRAAVSLVMRSIPQPQLHAVSLVVQQCTDPCHVTSTATDPCRCSSPQIHAMSLIVQQSTDPCRVTGRPYFTGRVAMSLIVRRIPQIHAVS